MKKTSVMIFGIFIFIFSMTFNFINYAEADTIKWKAVTTWTPAITLIKADQYFIELINQLCEGELEIQLFPAPQIVSSFEVFGAVQTGAVKMGFDWPGYWAGKDTAFGALGGLPAGPKIGRAHV